MVKKRKAANVSRGHDEPQPRKRVRNRASQFALGKLHTSYSPDQKEAVVQMELDSLLDIKCSFLHSHLIDWFCGLYDKHSREFVIPGRGRISLNVPSIYRTLGLPLGTQPVVYAVDSKIEESLGPQLFPTLGSTPKRTKLLYVDSLDVSSLNLNLPEGRFAVNIWSEADIEAVLAADLHNDDKKSYGKLELKPEFGVNYILFGGAVGFSKWMDTCSNPTCPIEQKSQVSNLMGSFASGMVGLMSSVVQGWTAMHGDAGDLVANTFGNVAQGFLSGLSASSAPAERVTRGGTSGTKGRYPTRSDAANTCNVLPEESTFLGDDTDRDSSYDGESGSDDDVVKYVVAPRKDKQVKFASSVGGDDAVLSHTAADVTVTLRSAPVSQRKGKQVKVCRFVGVDDLVLSLTSPEVTTIETQVAASSSADIEGMSVPEGSDSPDIPAADPGNDLIGDKMVWLSANEDVVMKATSVPDSTTPAYSPPAANVSDVFVDDLAVQDIPQVDDTTRQVEPLDFGGDGSDQSHLAQCPVVDANKNGKGKRRLQPLRVKDKEIRGIVANELGITTEMVQVCLPTRSKEVHDAKKATPKRKQILKRNIPATRSSPRLAKHRVSADSSKLGAPLPVIDVDPVSPETSAARVEVIHHNDAVMVDVNEGAANDAPGLDVDKGAAANPSLGPADLRPPSPPCSESSGTDALLRVVTNVVPRRHFDSQGNEFVSASTLFDPIPEPAVIKVSKHAEPSKKADNLLPVQAVTNVPVQVCPDGLVAGKSPLTYVENPMWNFTSQSPVCSEGPSVDNELVPVGPSVPVTSTTTSMGRPPYATLGDYDGTDDIPEGIPIEVPVEAIPLTTSHAPGDLFADFEGPEPLHLSWAIPSPPDEPKLNSKDQSRVISLDDLLLEKGEFQGVQSNNESKSCSNTSTAAVHDMCDLSTPDVVAHVIQVSSTPKTRLHRGRVIYPSKALLPPYAFITTSQHEDELYEKVIIHTRNELKSKIKGSRILQIDPMWVTTGELADSMKPNGLLSNTVCDIGVAVLQHTCPDNKLSFPVLQNIGTDKDPFGHWFVLSLNFEATRFEILDSLRGEDDEEMIKYANRLVDAIKIMYKVNYSESRKQIDEYELVYIPVPKQGPILNCGTFMHKFLELWNGSVVPAITADQIDAIRKILTVSWLEHPDNKLINWRVLLDNNMF
ncbi:hypothetical protein ACQ4PT_016611 [Festuca glaucescens]